MVLIKSCFSIFLQIQLMRRDRSICRGPASKWSCYLEDDKSLIESGVRGEDDLLQDGLEGEQVEEDVHPDFM